MKKNYFLTLVLMLVASISFGQNLLTNGDLESWDDDTTPTGWTKAESVTKSTESHGGSFSAFRNGGSGTKDLAQTITVEAGASYTISFWYKSSNSTATDVTNARIWSYWRSGGSNLSDNADELRGGSSTGYLNDNGGAWTEYSVTLTAPATADQLYFEVRSYSNSMVYWDDLSVVKNAQAVPSLSITSPADGSTVASGDVDVSLSVQNFTVGNTQSDDGYIKYTVDGGAATDKYDTNDIALTGLSEGEHTVEVELVKPDGSSLDTAVKKSVTFTVSSYTQVADLAALRAAATGAFYEITGGVVVTYVPGNSRNQIYLQDATGGLLIDDPNGAITTSYSVGDVITGLTGELKTYQTALQIQPDKDPGAATASGQSFTTTAVSMADYVADVAKDAADREYEHEFITIESATFEAADGTATFDTSDTRNYNITEGGDSMVMRISFNEDSFNGNVIPQNANSITGIGGQFGGTPQVFPIEFSGIALSAAKNQIEGFGVYPNPVVGSTFALRTASANTKNVAIFNVLGKQVLNTNVEGNNANVNIAGLNTGIYIVKVTENGKTATKKLVIK